MQPLVLDTPNMRNLNVPGGQRGWPPQLVPRGVEAGTNRNQPEQVSCFAAYV